MSLLDCRKCWSTPCDCGYDYRNWSRDARTKHASIVLGIPKCLLDEWLDANGHSMIPEKHPLHSEN